MYDKEKSMSYSSLENQITIYKIIIICYQIKLAANPEGALIS